MCFMIGLFVIIGVVKYLVTKFLRNVNIYGGQSKSIVVFKKSWLNIVFRGLYFRDSLKLFLFNLCSEKESKYITHK